MKSLVFTEYKAPLSYQDSIEPIAKEGQKLIKMQAAAFNRRDFWITLGLYPGIVPNCILGSDGVGEVDEKQYIINPNVAWGNGDLPGKNYTILGMPVNGTFAEYIAVDADRLVEKPAHLTTEQAAALPLGGLTAYHAVFGKCQLKKGERIFITGVGGGVSQMAVQFAIAAGAEVWVSSSSEAKILKAMEWGAKGGINYTKDDWAKRLSKDTGGFDVIIDSAGGEGFKDLIRIAKTGGRIGIYGGTRGAIPKLNPAHIFLKHLTIFGCTMGTDTEFLKMVDFVNEHKIVPLVDSVFALADGNKGLQKMAKGEQFGKVILNIKSS